MTIPAESIPRFSAGEALELADLHYGLTGNVACLPSERDQNFLIADPLRGKVVLKIGNRDDSLQLLDFQHQAMRRVAVRGCGIEVPRIVPSLAGADVETIESRAGAMHPLRVLSWIEGRVLAEQTPRAPVLLESVGASMAQVDLALADFEHPAMRRVLQWDLRHAGAARAHAASGAARAGWRAVQPPDGM